MSGNSASWWGSQANILNNLANSLLPVERLITGAAYLIGLAFAFKAIYSLKSYGESRTMMSSHASLKEPLVYLLVAGVFIYFPTALGILLQTSFGSSSILSYAPVGSRNDALNSIFGVGSVIGRPLTIIIQTVGIISFIRGWILIAKSASQGGQPQGGTGKGLMHIFGGILAMNIVGTLQIINNTIYGM